MDALILYKSPIPAGQTLLCLYLSACQSVSALPSRQVDASFDWSVIEVYSAVRIFDEVYFAYGAGATCHFNFDADPGFRPLTGQDIERRGQVVGGIVFKLIRDEVERRHPGNSGNDEAAWKIFATRSEEDGKRGYDEMKLKGCDKLRSTARQALINLVQFTKSQ